MEKVKVLVVGAAFCGDLHMEAYQRNADLARVVGICDKAIEKVQPLAKAYGITDYTAYDDYEKAIGALYKEFFS